MRRTVRRRPLVRPVGYYKRRGALGEPSVARTLPTRPCDEYELSETVSERTLRDICYTYMVRFGVAERRDYASSRGTFVTCFYPNELGRSFERSERYFVVRRRLGYSRRTVSTIFNFTNTALPRVGVERPNGSYVART